MIAVHRAGALRRWRGAQGDDRLRGSLVHAATHSASRSGLCDARIGDRIIERANPARLINRCSLARRRVAPAKGECMKMSTAVRFVVSVLATAIIAAVATYRVSAVPETSQSPADPIAALLVEVRALRIAMQQNATLAPRVQLTLARLNIEEQRIGQLASQLDQVRRELV